MSEMGIAACDDLRYTVGMTDEKQAIRPPKKMSPYTPKPRITQMRDDRGWTMEDSARRANTTKSTINKLEKGAVRLNEEWIARLAQAFGVSEAEIAGYPSTGAKMLSLCDDAAPYVAAPGDAEPDVPNEFPWEVKTLVLDQIDILPGDILRVSIAAEAKTGLTDGEILLCQLYDPVDPWDQSKARTALRQFRWPSLLTTNSSGVNEIVNMRSGAAAIVGRVISRRRPASPSANRP